MHGAVMLDAADTDDLIDLRDALDDGGMLNALVIGGEGFGL